MGVFGSGIYGAGVYGAAATLSVVVQDTYPDRLLLTVQGLVDGNTFSITRRVAGSTVRVPVRGADNLPMTSDAAVFVDAEEPFGVELTYTLTIDGIDAESELVTVTLAGGKVALSDAIAGNAAEVVILAWPDKSYEVPGSVFKVPGRNIVVSGQAGGWEGGLELVTETNDARANVIDLIGSATSGILQIRQAGSDPRRVLALDVVEVEPWAPGLASSTFTWADVAAAYTGETWADLAADYGSWLEVAQGDFSA